MKLGLKTNQDSISEAAEEWQQKNGPLSTEERLLFSVMRKSKHNGDGSFTPDEVLKVVKAFGYEQKRIQSPKKIIVGLIVAFVIYVAIMTGLVVWATGLAKDYSIGSDGAMVNGGRSVTTGLTLTKKGLMDLIAASEQELMSVEGIMLDKDGDLGWAHYKVASVHRESSTMVLFETQGGHKIQVAADNSVHLDGTKLATASASAVLASNTILT